MFGELAIIKPVLIVEKFRGYVRRVNFLLALSIDFSKSMSHQESGLKSFTLDEAVDQTLLRGQFPIRLASLNFSNEGVRALNGVLPIFTGGLSEQTALRLANKYDFSLDNKVTTGGQYEYTGEYDGDSVANPSPPEPNNTWRTFLTTNPADRVFAPVFAEKKIIDSNFIPEQFIAESLNIYESTLGIKFEVNNPKSLELSDDAISIGFIGTNGIMPLSVADTETRERFMKQFNGNNIAGFTYINLPYFTGNFNGFNYEDDLPPTANEELKRNYAKTSSTLIESLSHEVFKNTIHEIGHLLGLAHPGNYNGLTPNIDELIWDRDEITESLMSYVTQKDYKKFFAEGDGVNVIDLTPRTLDFLALDKLYGNQKSSEGISFGTANAFRGDTVYGFNSNISPEQSAVYASMNEVFDYLNGMTVVDGSGLDTFDFSGYHNDSLIDLQVIKASDTQSRFSQINGRFNNLSLGVATVIENAIGGFGNDTLIDNAYANQLDGGEGDDTFLLSRGDDIVDGGKGADTAIFSGKKNQRKITNLFDGTTMVEGNDSRVILKNIESILFEDELVSLCHRDTFYGQSALDASKDAHLKGEISHERELLDLYAWCKDNVW